MVELRIAHLSDVHFGNPCYKLTQFLSKRWIGNLNFLLFRRRKFQSKHLCLLPELFKELKIDKICFTGDFTTTALPEEFSLAQKFLELFPQPFFVLPGNHDVYTKESEKTQTFYQYFPEIKGECGFSLKKDRLFCKKIKKGWSWIALDCAVSTPPFQAYGIFTNEMAEKLLTLLSSLPKQENVIVGNHFPLFSSKKNVHHDLKNAELLRKTLKKFFPQIKLYLHGHIHKPLIINKMQDGYPLVLNSGSSAYVENGGFYHIELQEKKCYVAHFFYSDTKGWRAEKTYEYAFLKG